MSSRTSPRRGKRATGDGPSLHSLLSQASRQVTSELRRLVGAEGLPVEFWRVLEVMADERGRSISELAEAAGMQMSATSKLVDRMVDAALLQRSTDPRDQRRVILHVSDIGIDKIASLKGDIRQHRDSVADAFGAEQEARLRELLQDFILAHRRASR